MNKSCCYDVILILLVAHERGDEEAFWNAAAHGALPHGALNAEEESASKSCALCFKGLTLCAV